VTGASAGRQSVSLIDPGYKVPGGGPRQHRLRPRAGVLGLVGTGEFLYTENLKEIKYQNLNYVRVGSLPDGRFTYQKKDANLNDALLLTNSALGRSWTATVKVDRPFKNGWQFGGSYLFGHARSVNDGTASTADRTGRTTRSGTTRTTRN